MILKNRIHSISILMLSLILILSGCQSSVSDQEIKVLQEKIIQLQEKVALQGDLVEKTQETLDTTSDLNDNLTEEIGALEAENEQLKQEVLSLQSEIEDLSEAGLNETPNVVLLSQVIVQMLSEEDFIGVSDYVHPSLGLRLTPYPYIDLGSDVVITSAQMATMATDPTIYNFGNYDGSGDPINLTLYDYYNAFIYDVDFAMPESITYNASLASGNMINNMATSYPTADYVEFYFSGFNPTYDGMDWRGLTLVFEWDGTNWYLVGLVHGQWTI